MWRNRYKTFGSRCTNKTFSYHNQPIHNNIPFLTLLRSKPNLRRHGRKIVPKLHNNFANRDQLLLRGRNSSQILRRSSFFACPHPYAASLSFSHTQPNAYPFKNELCTLVPTSQSPTSESRG